MKVNRIYFLSCIFFLLITPVLVGFSLKAEVIKTIYIVRHAEKDLTDTTDNPPLTEAGEKRANSLEKLLKDEPLNHIYSTAYQRNINTVTPLAIAKNLTLETYQWYGYSDLVETIKSSSDQSFLICGHGDNIIPIIELFGGKSPVKKLDKDEYDKLFKVTYSSNQKTKVEMLVY